MAPLIWLQHALDEEGQAGSQEVNSLPKDMLALGRDPVIVALDSIYIIRV